MCDVNHNEQAMTRTANCTSYTMIMVSDSSGWEFMVLIWNIICTSYSVNAAS
jgi:hypothetical protein